MICEENFCGLHKQGGRNFAVLYYKTPKIYRWLCKSYYGCV